MIFDNFSVRAVCAGLLSSLCLAGFAQPAGTLYDPEPPADSAYLRVLIAGQESRLDVDVDGKSRVKRLLPGTASDYMVLEAGRHTLAIRNAGSNQDRITTTVDLEPGSATTVGFPSLKAGIQPIFFPDKKNSNKLKALLVVYHLDSNLGQINISTADGKTKIFSDLNFGKSASIQVNPISIDLAVTSMGDGTVKGRPALAMTQGGVYSVFLMTDSNKKLVTNVQESRVERYVKVQ